MDRNLKITVGLDRVGTLALDEEKRKALEAEAAVAKLKKTAAAPSPTPPGGIAPTGLSPTGIVPAVTPRGTYGPPRPPPPVTDEMRRESRVVEEMRKARESQALQATRERMGAVPTDWYKATRKEWGEESAKGRGLRMGMASIGMAAGSMAAGAPGAMGGVISGGLAGASMGMGFGPMGAGIGAAAGVVFGGIKSAFETVSTSGERLKQTMGTLADSLLRAERTTAAIRRGDPLGIEALSSLDELTRARVLRAPMGPERMGVIRGALEEARTPVSGSEITRRGALAAIMPFVPVSAAARGAPEISTIAAERTRAATIAILETALSKGIPGVTEEERKPPEAPGDALTLYEGIMRDAAARTGPVERTATATEGILGAAEGILASLSRITGVPIRPVRPVS